MTIREHFHFSVIADRLSQNSLRTAQAVDLFTRGVSPKAPGSNVAHMQALAELANMVRGEAYVMAYSDCFFVLGIALLLCTPLLFLIPKPKQAAAIGH